MRNTPEHVHQETSPAFLAWTPWGGPRQKSAGGAPRRADDNTAAHLSQCDTHRRGTNKLQAEETPGRLSGGRRSREEASDGRGGRQHHGAVRSHVGVSRQRPPWLATAVTRRRHVRPRLCAKRLPTKGGSPRGAPQAYPAGRPPDRDTDRAWHLACRPSNGRERGRQRPESPPRGLQRRRAGLQAPEPQARRPSPRIRVLQFAEDGALPQVGCQVRQRGKRLTECDAHASWPPRTLRPRGLGAPCKHFLDRLPLVVSRALALPPPPRRLLSEPLE